MTDARDALEPPAAPASGRDVLRQVAVISAVVFMIVAAMVGVGLFGGTSVRDLQGGALDADATYLAPARPAFGIWSLIYVLMVGYAVWQALPGQRARERQRAVGWWVALTAVLNGGWLLAAQFLNLGATVLAIVILLAALGWTLERLHTYPGVHTLDLVLLDAGVGLHLGWVALATVANVTAWLTVSAPPSWGDAPEPWGIAVLIVVGLVGLALTVFTAGRLAPGLAMGWGLVWIGFGRTDDPISIPIAVTAWIVAGVVVFAPFLVKLFTLRAGSD